MDAAAGGEEGAEAEHGDSGEGSFPFRKPDFAIRGI
jgi:hypothetical protein